MAINFQVSLLKYNHADAKKIVKHVKDNNLPVSFTDTHQWQNNGRVANDLIDILNQAL